VALALSGAALALLTATTKPSSALAHAPVPAAPKVTARPLHYLLRAQNRDGGFGAAPGAPSSPLYSSWVALALAAAGDPAAGVHAMRGLTLRDYLSRNVGARSDADTLERTILAVRALGADPHDFGGRDLVRPLERDVSRGGSVQQQTNLTSFAVLALRAAGVRPPKSMLSWLVRQQDRDGGFNFATAPGTSDVDDTAAVVEALAGSRSGAGVDRAQSRTLRRAVAFLDAAQNPDGGFPSEPGGLSNAQSTSFAVQGLIAAGVDPLNVRRHGHRSPVGYLESLIARNGHVRYQERLDPTPVWVSAQALLALAGKPLPVAPGAADGDSWRLTTNLALAAACGPVRARNLHANGADRAFRHEIPVRARNLLAAGVDCSLRQHRRRYWSSGARILIPHPSRSTGQTLPGAPLDYKRHRSGSR
jgi:prenyltransferase beta subunit